jgi:polyphosphate kinase
MTQSGPTNSTVFDAEASAVAPAVEPVRGQKKKMKKEKEKKKKEKKALDASGAALSQVTGNGHRKSAGHKGDDGAATAETGAKATGNLTRKSYEKQLRRLQTELCRLQDWVTSTGQRIVIVFEGRDAAGKGGIIRALTERVSPRVFRVAALPAPSDREKSQIYAQRYLQHFPAAGEIVIFDRSWYNRAGVERVMGFTTEEKYQKFLVMCPKFENVIIDNGIILIKYWLEVSDGEQERRFKARIKDPMRQWKLSAMDLPSRQKWYEYSRARDMMLMATDTDASPWHIVRSDDKRHARLNVISHLLSIVPYKATKRPKVRLPARSKKHAYDDLKPMQGRRWIPEVQI